MDIKTALQELNEIWDSDNDRIRSTATAEDVERVRADVSMLPPEEQEAFSDIFDRIDKVLKGERMSSPLKQILDDINNGEEPELERDFRSYVEDAEEEIAEDAAEEIEPEDDFFNIAQQKEQQRQARVDAINEGRRKVSESAEREMRQVKAFNEEQEQYRRNDALSQHTEYKQNNVETVYDNTSVYSERYAAHEQNGYDRRTSYAPDGNSTGYGQKSNNVREEAQQYTADRYDVSGEQPIGIHEDNRRYVHNDNPQREYDTQSQVYKSNYTDSATVGGRQKIHSSIHEDYSQKDKAGAAPSYNNNHSGNGRYGDNTGAVHSGYDAGISGYDKIVYANSVKQDAAKTGQSRYTQNEYNAQNSYDTQNSHGGSKPEWVNKYTNDYASTTTATQTSKFYATAASVPAFSAASAATSYGTKVSRNTSGGSVYTPTNASANSRTYNNPHFNASAAVDYRTYSSTAASQRIQGTTPLERKENTVAERTSLAEKTRDGGSIYVNKTSKNHNYGRQAAQQAIRPAVELITTMGRAAFGQETSQVRNAVSVGSNAIKVFAGATFAVGASASIISNGLSGTRNRALQGKAFDVDGVSVKVAGNYHSFTVKGANKKMSAFRAENASLLAQFVNKKGKLDTAKLNSEIKALNKKVLGKTATGAEIKRLESLKQFSGLARNSAKNNLRKASVKGGIKASAALLSMAFSVDPTTQKMLMAAKFSRVTAKAGIGVAKLGFRTTKLLAKGGKFIAKKTGLTNTKLVLGGKGKIEKVKQSIKLTKNNIKKSIAKAPGLAPAKKTIAKLKGGIRKIGNSTAGRVIGKITGGVKKVVGTTMKVATAPIQVVTKSLSALADLKKYLIGAAAAALLIIFLFTLLALLAVSIFSTFAANDNTLQKYINYSVKVSQKWEDGDYDGSKVNVLQSDGTYTSKSYSLNDIYELDGSTTGKWRIITTVYVDADGNEIDSADNLKEILSMVAVKIDNNWAGWSSSDTDSDLDVDSDSEDDDYDYEYETETDENGNVIEDDYTIKKSDIKKMIKYLYLASHSFEAVESEPYKYTIELNNVAVSYLLNGETVSKTLIGDAEGEGCQTRTFYCNEDITDEDYSDYRYTLCTSDYNTRGGCEVYYEGGGTYNSATDTFVCDDGTKYTNAHSLPWATDEMIELWELSQENGGEGDEARYKHGDGEAMDTLPSGCKSYEISYAHGDDNGVSTNTPSCSNYSVSLPSNTVKISLPSDCTAVSKASNYKSSFVLTWSYAKDVYYYNYADSSGTYTRAEVSSMTTYLGDEITYYKNSYDGYYYPSGTTFTCKDTAYYCLEEEYYCDGHDIDSVTIYYCPGHTEYYCDGNHYDITVTITINHMDDESIYYADVENDYDYKRKAVAVSDYPEDFDRMTETLASDFYWSSDNIEWAEQLEDGDWNELYDVYGIEDISSVLDEDNIDAYFAYLEVETIYGWAEASDGDGGAYEYPLDAYGNAIDFEGGQWFYDDSGGEYDGLYVYVVYSYTQYMYNTGYYYLVCNVTKTSETNPLAVSEDRIALVEFALSCVGVIPYQENGQPANYTLEDFGVDENGDLIRGLNSGGFVNFCLLQTGLGTSKTGSIKTIYNNTYSIDGSETDSYYGTGNLDDLSTVDWSEYEDASELRQAIIDRALEVVESGIPYSWGGTSLTTGVDCSGFVASVYAEFGILDSKKASTHSYCSYTFRTLGYAVSYDEVQPGDVLCYDGHVAFYLDETHIIEACNSEIGLRVYECNPFTYDEGVLTIRSLIVDESEHSDTYTSSSTTTLSVGNSLSENAQTIYNYFAALDDGYGVTFSEYALAGILGNVAADSSMLANYYSGSDMTGSEYAEAVEDGTISKSTFVSDGYAFGLFYFNSKEMKTYLYNYTIGKGLSLTDVEGQCNALYNYIKDNYLITNLFSALNEATDASEAASAYRNYIENTIALELSDVSTSTRQAYASQYYQVITGKTAVGGYEDDLLPGDIGLINTYYGRIEDGSTVYNQAAIYLGENELGQQLWISCSASTGWVSVITSSAFRYYRRLECW